MEIYDVLLVMQPVLACRDTIETLTDAVYIPQNCSSRLIAALDFTANLVWIGVALLDQPIVTEKIHSQIFEAPCSIRVHPCMIHGFD